MIFMEETNLKEVVVNIVINIAIPILLLMKFSYVFGALNTFLIALMFPLVYGLYDFFKEHKINFYSLIGIFGILVTVGIGFLKLDPEFIAINKDFHP